MPDQFRGRKGLQAAQSTDKADTPPSPSIDSISPLPTIKKPPQIATVIRRGRGQVYLDSPAVGKRSFFAQPTLTGSIETPISTTSHTPPRGHGCIPAAPSQDIEDVWKAAEQEWPVDAREAKYCLFRASTRTEDYLLGIGSAVGKRLYSIRRYQEDQLEVERTHPSRNAWVRAMKVSLPTSNLILHAEIDAEDPKFPHQLSHRLGDTYYLKPAHTEEGALKLTVTYAKNDDSSRGTISKVSVYRGTAVLAYLDFWNAACILDMPGLLAMNGVRIVDAIIAALLTIAVNEFGL